ncbi:MAG: hypothetical protein ACO3AT_07955, partial [Ilumatobacteraceae bacterium]
MTSEPALRLFDPDGTPEPFRVEVIRSKKRRRSISAQLVGDVLRVSIPAWMSTAEEESSVADMVRRFRRRMATHDID